MIILKKRTEVSRRDTRKLVSTVESIISDVKARGDQALFDFNKKFDGSGRKLLRVTAAEIKEAYQKVDDSLLQAISISHRNIKAFAAAQKEALTEIKQLEIMPGILVGHRLLPVDSCCCYVPGGGYPLFSTALMLAVPAKIAGVKRIAACSPPVKGTEQINPATLVAMDMAGVDEIYTVGGAQAIAAFTYGTEQIERTDIIVGPGNQYVTEAKRQCFGPVGIDFVAGPSEILIIADRSATPEIIAADLLAQAEHDLQARSILITECEELGKKVLRAIDKQLSTLPTKDTAARAWENNGEVIVVKTIEKACELSNSYAPEHLELMVQNPEPLIEQLTNYGSLFIGTWSAEVFGDYLSGTNHSLPTSEAARYTGGVWAGTFIKVCTHQRLTSAGLLSAAGPTIALAEAEGLFGHSNAVKIRQRILKKQRA